MKKAKSPEQPAQEPDTMRASYDFRAGKRGVTAARYASGVNVVVIDPDLLDIFPNSASVNDALRALAPLLRHGQVDSVEPPKRRPVSAATKNPAIPRRAATRRRNDG